MSTEQSTETGPICADCGGSEGKMFETSDDRGMRHVDLTACIRHLRFLRDADAKRATEQTHHAVARLNIAARDRGEIQDRLTALYERLGEAEDEIADIQLTSEPWYTRILGLEKRLAAMEERLKEAEEDCATVEDHEELLGIAAQQIAAMEEYVGIHIGTPSLPATCEPAPEPGEPEYRADGNWVRRKPTGDVILNYGSTVTPGTAARYTVYALNRETDRVRWETEEKVKAEIKRLKDELWLKSDRIAQVKGELGAVEDRADAAEAEVSRLREQWRNRPLTIGDTVRDKALGKVLGRIRWVGTHEVAIGGPDELPVWQFTDRVERVPDDAGEEKE